MRWIFAMVLSVMLTCSLVPRAHAGEVDTGGKANHPFFKSSMMLGAHRGGRGIYPENTAYAFRAAAERWPDVVLEGDVHVTSDGQLVMIHDRTVDRTTDGKGNVSDMTLAELQALDAAYNFQPKGEDGYPLRGKGVRMPTLAEALAAAPHHRFLVEMKAGMDIAAKVARVVREAGATDRFIVASFVPAYMAAIRLEAPEMLTCFEPASAMMMITALRSDVWDAYTPRDSLLTFSPDMMDRLKISPEELSRVQAKGIRVQLHTINEPEEMRKFIALGVDGMLTDYPDILAEVMKENPVP